MMTTMDGTEHYDFNPRSPWGERPLMAFEKEKIKAISIHAPRGGSDGALFTIAVTRFISIHAPRGGSDLASTIPLYCPTYFNPRSPWGERHIG